MNSRGIPRPAPFRLGTGSSVSGIETAYFECGAGAPLVPLHGGEFGAYGRISWEYNVATLSHHFRVIVPDWLGYGSTAKLHDFEDFATRMLWHMGQFCRVLSVEDAVFVGNSMGASFLLRDAASIQPRLPARAIIAISGGMPVPDNNARRALVDYDGSFGGMKRIVGALFASDSWPADSDYVARRHEASLIFEAWQCAAAAHFRPPTGIPRQPADEIDYGAITVPTLLIAGSADKLKPRGWASALHEQIPRSSAVEIDHAGHCPQIERADVMTDLICHFGSATSTSTC